ncbi:hypothetical protein Ciccas_003870 [Cichlidogyrus casuarinus]|uniref:Uncharacterized protein n=1 Tax=Cichlidogyrus casuarinus TaxID=1844966 RepID=A0ABD2QD65_9PLAT
MHLRTIEFHCALVPPLVGTANLRRLAGRYDGPLGRLVVEERNACEELKKVIVDGQFDKALICQILDKV